MRIERIGDATLYLGDCREILPTLGRVDAVVTDPPYGIGMAAEQTIGSSNRGVVADYGRDSWDDRTDPEGVNLARSISRHQIIFGGNYYDLPPSSCWLVWDKQNSGDFADCELAWTNLPGAVRRIYWRWNGMIRRGDDIRVHPTQKPVGVMTWCIERLPESVETILDPYAGSGTTGVACARMGKRFVGIEKSPRHFESMCRRLDEACRQPADLFIESPAKAVQEAMTV